MPESENGVFIDDNDFVWFAGNGKRDSQLPKFTMNVTFILQIGKLGDGPFAEHLRGSLLTGARS